MTQVADVFANRYTIEREIARGGMADVFLAYDQQLKRPVAVKVLFPEFARDPSFVERFRREAQNAASLNHPNIAAVYDWGQERGTYFIVMEYVEGRSLRDIIRHEGTIPAAAAARVASDLAGALAAAHRHGVVHRDVKPGNVLITATGHVKLTDFGIAANPLDATQGLTQTGSVMGTATYFSPEQAQGFPVDGRSDVYSLGVVLYEMLTGAPPFSGESPVAVAMKHVRDDPPRPSRRIPDLPPALEAVVMKALTKDVDARYQSADDLQSDLLDFERGRPLTYAHAPAPVVVAPEAAATAATAAPAYYEAPPPRRAAPIIATIIGLGLLAAVIAYLLVTASKKDSASAVRIAVPSVIGQTFDEGSTKLKDLGFSVSRLDDEASTLVPGTILRQDPPGGRLLEKGDTITLTVSGAEATLPDLIGQPIDQAQLTLERLGFRVERVNVDTSDKTVGTVLATDPPAKTRAAKGSTVKVNVAAVPGVDVPDLRGKSSTEAQATLNQLGLVPNVSTQASDSVPKDQVIGIDPAPGTRIPKGSTVKLIVSTGPQQVNVPNVVGQKQADATATLTGAGFNVVVNPVNAGPTRTGLVVTQSPAAGTPSTVGATVTINVGT